MVKLFLTLVLKFLSMNIKLNLTDKIAGQDSAIYLIEDEHCLKQCHLSKKEIDYVLENFQKNKKSYFTFNRLTHFQIIVFIKSEKSIYHTLEFLRKEGQKSADFINKHNLQAVTIKGINDADPGFILAFAEGLILGNYNFTKYKSKQKPNSLQNINLLSKAVKPFDLAELEAVTEAVCHCRDLVNTPFHELHAKEFAKRITGLCKPLGVKTEILNKTQIASLKMSGLLAVNQGSVNEPTFTKLEWKPGKSINQDPIILVGKGIVYDTGGLSLKPASAMMDMKSDMAGGSAVFGAIYAIAKTKLPVHVIGLIPATDNQPGDNAITPGDVISMSNKVTVEVLNTDAEGRLILADALLYASKYNPSLVIDIATLTGSATRAIGKYGIVSVESGAELYMAQLKEAGMEVYERIAEFPFWDEYDKEIESDIADIRNIGKNNNAGAITAAKFLGRFISYPWIHLDIAGMAFLDQKESYLGKGATGVGVRLLYRFVKDLGHGA